MLALALATAVALSGAPSTAKKTQLLLEVKPESVVIYVDGKRKGTAGKVRTVKVTPGTHLIKLVNGRDVHEEPVTVKSGQSLTWKMEFGDDKPKSVRGDDEKPSGDGDGEQAQPKDTPADKPAPGSLEEALIESPE